LEFKKENKDQASDPFTDLMFFREQSNQGNNQNQNPSNTSLSSLQQQLEGGDMVGLLQNIDHIMKFANEVGPVLKQLSPLLALFSKNNKS
jgi:hypothetical protein